MYTHTYTHSCTCIFITWDIFPLLLHYPGLLQQTITSFGTYILMWYLPLLRDQSLSRAESDGGRKSHRCEFGGGENVIMVHESNISFPLPFLLFFVTLYIPCYPLHTVRNIVVVNDTIPTKTTMLINANRIIHHSWEMFFSIYTWRTADKHTLTFS